MEDLLCSDRVRRAAEKEWMDEKLLVVIDSHQYLPLPPVKEDFGISISLPFSRRMDVDLTEKEVEEGTLVLR